MQQYTSKSTRADRGPALSLSNEQMAVSRLFWLLGLFGGCLVVILYLLGGVCGVFRVVWGIPRGFRRCSGGVQPTSGQQTANTRPTNNPHTSRVLFVGRLWSFVGRLLVEQPQNTHRTPLEYLKQPQANPKQPPNNHQTDPRSRRRVTRDTIHQTTRASLGY